jgi:hypothetical protein
VDTVRAANTAREVNARDRTDVLPTSGTVSAAGLPGGVPPEPFFKFTLPTAGASPAVGVGSALNASSW